MIVAHLSSTNKLDGGSLLLPINIKTKEIPSKIVQFAATNGFKIKNDFISILSELINRDLGALYPHVTIFTKGSKDGIGIYSKPEFENHVLSELT